MLHMKPENSWQQYAVLLSTFCYFLVAWYKDMFDIFGNIISQDTVDRWALNFLQRSVNVTLGVVIPIFHPLCYPVKWVWHNEGLICSAFFFP